MCGFWFLNISCSFHFRGVLIRSKLCYYPYTELKNLQKEKKDEELSDQSLFFICPTRQDDNIALQARNQYD
ncbi:hypothetical protein SG0102_07320 [Intestinibaculum porci]|uniref:Uncharacterized protein n=1 Tax=Intestinibaculum porci TaxID=2487118 RepID=A0A3G9JNI8_9FIRM|nr:hypothetical protein SG0102_07320 [Intestinibaculum porci]